jgi:hypothetical protein
MALVVLALCCLSSSVGVGGFFGGLIPGTEPHFMKVAKAKEMKDIVKDLKKFINDYETQIQTKFPNAGPDLSGLSTEDRAEYITMAKENMTSLRVGEICVKVKDNTDKNGKFLGKEELKEYTNNVFTLNGNVSKNKLFGDYIGLDDNIDKSKVDEMVGVCLATDEEFDELIN